MIEGHKTLLLSVVVFVVTAIVYLPSSRYEFVAFDDPDYVLKNEHIRHGLTCESVQWALTNRGYADNWHPVCWMSLMLDVNMLDLIQHGKREGKSPVRISKMLASKWVDAIGRQKLSTVMHLHNVLLHAANAAFLFLLMAVVVKKRVPEVWLVGFSLLWALHPLRVEVVCWVTERKELLSVFWMLLSLLAYIRSRSALSRIAAVVCAGIAMMAKPVAVTLPAVLFAWDWIYRKEMPWLKTAPFWMLSVATCLLTMQAQTESVDCGNTLNIAGRLSAVFVAPLVYIRQTFWPTDLTFVYEAPDTLNIVAFSAGVILVLLIVGVCLYWLWRRLRRRGEVGTPDEALDVIVFAIAWVYVGLLPMLGIVKVGCLAHNDRYTYWIGCGVAVVAAMCLPVIARAVHWLVAYVEMSGGIPADQRLAREEKCRCECRQLRKMSQVVLAVSVAASICLTTRQMAVWRNSLVLFRDAIPKCLSTDVAWPLAELLCASGGDGREEAEMWLRESVNHNKSMTSLGNLAEFLLTNPESSFVYKMTGRAYGEAEDIINEMLSADPENVRAKKLQGQLLDQRKQLEK